MDVLALGTPIMDFYAKVSRQELERLGLAAGATNYLASKKLDRIICGFGKKIKLVCPGDNARNFCEWFSAMGGSCGYCGAVGKDEEGERFLESLRKDKILPFVEAKSGRTGRILVLITPDKERTFCANLGVGTKYSKVEAEVLEKSKALFFTSITVGVPSLTANTALKLAEIAKSKGKKVAFALESWKMVKEKRSMLRKIAKKYADIVLMNEEEAQAFFGGEISPAQFKPSAAIFIKKGKEGSVLFYRKEKFVVPAIRARVVDTTAAGDAYAAGAIYGIIRGYSPFSSAKLGCIAATKAIQQLGTSAPF
ncbi:MAG: adenosine kinase [Candidatus Anstonellaceae archaeon]